MQTVDREGKMFIKCKAKLQAELVVFIKVEEL